MSATHHATQVGRAIGVLESLANRAPQPDAVTLNSTADLLRDYGRCAIDVSVDVEQPGDVDDNDLRAAVIVLGGHATEWAELEHLAVIDNAIELIEHRLQGNE